MYKLNTSGVTRLADNASIPAAIGNSDYVEYLEWAKTNTAEPQFTAAEILANTKRDTNALINAQLASANLLIIDALVDNDGQKIAAHKVAQALLRAGLIV